MLTMKSFLSLVYINIHFLMGNNIVGWSAAAPTYVSVGVVLDTRSPLGIMANSCISMAHEDFYSAHPDYQTRLSLHSRDAQDQLDVASAVLELMHNDKVHGIIGPQIFTQDTFLAELGGKAHVPMISFTARSQSPSRTETRRPYFIRTAPDDSNQAKALAAICQRFEWPEAIILYEDTDYGNQFTSKLNKAFQEADIRLAYTVALSTSAEDHHIMKELENLVTRQTRVFLVHMNPVLGSKLFVLAKQAKMMSEGYAWLITDSLGNFMNYSLDPEVIDSMEGVLGLRPHVPKSNNLSNFRSRWKMKPESRATELNAYGFWAYDTVWALAMALEKVAALKPGFLKLNHSKIPGSDISKLRISLVGPQLLSQLQSIKFEGLSGKFDLIEGQLKISALEIFNVYGTGDRQIGYWTPDGGITKNLALTGRKSYSTSTTHLKRILWPGDSHKQPKGWTIPSELKVGVPVKSGFTEFVSVKDPHTNEPQFKGFSIDIFTSAFKLLQLDGVSYKFIPFANSSGKSNGTYNNLLQNITDKTFDIVVGDTTIMADRAKYVDFTLPYSDSGIVMVVKTETKNMWTFVKPFSWDLWLSVLCACLLIGVSLRILEHRVNNASDSVQHRLGLLFLFPIVVLAFPDRNMVANNWARFLLVVWWFMAYILMQSYTANLSAIFTVEHLDYRPSDDCYIGYQEGSFVKDFLINGLGYREERLRQYSTMEEYHKAMSNGSKRGGIDAIFDETPYMNLFLSKYDSKYKIVGPTYRTDGFGFAFPLGSPLVVPISKKILEVTGGANMSTIEQRNFGPDYSSANKIDSTKAPPLITFSFLGPFILLGLAMLLSLFCSETPPGRRLAALVTVCCHTCFFFLSRRRNEPRVQSLDHSDSVGDSSTKEEVNQGSDQNIANDSFTSDIDDQSAQNSLNDSARPGQGNDSEQRHSKTEIQLSETGNLDSLARHQPINEQSQS